MRLPTSLVLGCLLPSALGFVLPPLRFSVAPSRSKLAANSLEDVPEYLSGTIIAIADESGAKIDCYPESYALIGDSRYLIANPRDWPVAVAYEEEGDLVPLAVDDELMDQVFPILKEQLSEGGLKLLRTPMTLTLQGLDELEAEGGEGEWFEDEEEEEGTAGLEVTSAQQKALLYEEEEDYELEEDEEDVELISEFEIEGVGEFLLVRMLDPLLILAEETELGYKLLEPDNDDQVREAVEDLLANAMFGIDS